MKIFRVHYLELWYSSPIIISKKSISLTFHLHYSSFTYKLFFSSLFNIFSISLSYPYLLFVSTIILLIKLPTFSMLIKFFSNLFTIAWNMAGEFVSLKNMTVNSNNLFDVVKTAFYLFLFFILML